MCVHAGMCVLVFFLMGRYCLEYFQIYRLYCFLSLYK